MSLQAVSDNLQVTLSKVSRIERGLQHDPEFVERYEAWLTNQIAA
ncbi:MAG: hypothetical protein ACYCPT_10405 [Acidimicrobiales bacterium]